MGAIDVEALDKRFGSVRALTGLELHVEAGEVHGFLGPNGAGKTTTIRVLLGMVRADGGDVRALGLDPWRDAVALHRRLAFVPGEVDLWGQLTGEDTLRFLSRLRGGTDAAEERRLVERFELDTSRRVSTYSKGNRQKVALVAALSSGVELFLLDEPTDGLDPLMVEVFREELGVLRARGATVLLSSHQLSEVEEVCDRVTILRDGRAVEAGTLDSLRQLARVQVRAATRRPMGTVTGLRGLTGVEATATTLRCEVGTDELDALLGVLHAAGVVSLECRPPSLEAIFLSHYTAARGAPGT